eukprot:TRINITY_DN3607_c0_g1_i9.p1 TRINITY_DN3607_c0_g1~~TRINITY_DN3607_c0_g1_i9.p1  ORF type:complete len:156 (+),score=45.64 TRINITY_DN3607_c0_g1_i9:178-645(+)
MCIRDRYQRRVRGFRFFAMSMSSLRLQPDREEGYEFCIRSFELSERTITSTLTSCSYSAAFLKRQITVLPSNSGSRYSRLYHAYSAQIVHLRGLKSLVAIAQRVGWRKLITTVRKQLSGLPLSGSNIQLLTQRVTKMYPNPHPQKKNPPAEVATP